MSALKFPPLKKPVTHRPLFKQSDDLRTRCSRRSLPSPDSLCHPAARTPLQSIRALQDSCTGLHRNRKKTRVARSQLFRLERAPRSHPPSRSNATFQASGSSIVDQACCTIQPEVVTMARESSGSQRASGVGDLGPLPVSLVSSAGGLGQYQLAGFVYRDFRRLTPRSVYKNSPPGRPSTYKALGLPEDRRNVREAHCRFECRCALFHHVPIRPPRLSVARSTATN